MTSRRWRWWELVILDGCGVFWALVDWWIGYGDAWEAVLTLAVIGAWLILAGLR